MIKTGMEITVAQHAKDINRIGVGMDKMVNSMDGLRKDLNECGASALKMMNAHAIEDSNRFGRLETKLALYVGAGMCFVAFAKDIVIGVSSSLGH